MNPLMNKYKEWLIYNNKSTTTRKNYLSRIKTFLKESDNKVTKTSITNFFVTFQKKNSPATMNSYRVALKSFLKCIGKDILLPESFKVETRLPEFIEEKYLTHNIIPVIEQVSSNPLQFKTILSFMFYTGIRISELIELQRTDIDLQNKEIKIHERKTNSERLVALNPKTKKLLEIYFAKEKEQTNAFNITKRGLEARISRLKPYFEDINLHPHLFRHSFATRLRKAGVDTADIQKLMGHKSIQTTMRYAHTDIKRLKEIINKVN